VWCWGWWFGASQAGGSHICSIPGRTEVDKRMPGRIEWGAKWGHPWEDGRGEDVHWHAREIEERQRGVVKEVQIQYMMYKIICQVPLFESQSQIWSSGYGVLNIEFPIPWGRSWVPGTLSRGPIPSAEYRVPSPKSYEVAYIMSQNPSSRHQVLKPECQISSCSWFYWVPDIMSQNPSFRYWVLNSFSVCWVPDIKSWYLSSM